MPHELPYTRRAFALIAVVRLSCHNSTSAFSLLPLPVRSKRPAVEFVQPSSTYRLNDLRMSMTAGTPRASSAAMAHTDITAVDAAASNRLSRFLRQSTADVHRMMTEYPKAVVHAYVGNEACDADSICSAICMAFLMSSAANLGEITGAAESTASEHSAVRIPVIPMIRSDLPLRREVLVLFDLCGIDPTALTFIDELDLSTLHAQGRLRLSLLDHNAVSGPLLGLDDAVVEIVDHHRDLGEHPRVRGSARDIAFDATSGNGHPFVGSCCTLVTERILKHAPALLSSSVARLLLGVVLIDTVNLDVESRRVTARDIQAARELSRRTSQESPTPTPSDASGKPSTVDIDVVGDAAGGVLNEKIAQRRVIESSADARTSSDALFVTLRDAKFEPEFWRGLSAEDCLRYDYKQFTPRCPKSRAGNVLEGPRKTLNFGMSSVLCRLETLEGKEGIWKALQIFTSRRGVDSLWIMTATFDGSGKSDLRRELLVFVTGNSRKNHFDKIKMFLECPQVDFLQLKQSPVAHEGGVSGKDKEYFVAQWELGNTRPSRKQVVPVVMTFYESLDVDRNSRDQR